MNSTQLVPVLTHCPSPASLWGASWPLAPDPASSDLTAAVCVGQWVHSSHGAVCRKDLPYVSVKAYFWGGREGGGKRRRGERNKKWKKEEISKYGERKKERREAKEKGWGENKDGERFISSEREEQEGERRQTKTEETERERLISFQIYI